MGIKCYELISSLRLEASEENRVGEKQNIPKKYFNMRCLRGGENFRDLEKVRECTKGLRLGENIDMLCVLQRPRIPHMYGLYEINTSVAVGDV